MADDPRSQILRAVSDNVAAFTAERVEALFVSMVAELVDGGVDHIRVEASMMRAWVAIQLAHRGPGAVAELLRDFADRVERPALNSQNSTQPH